MLRRLFVVGLSHHTAPVELREGLAVRTEQLAAELKQWTTATGLDEAVLLSTCNRVELYSTHPDPDAAIAAVKQVFVSKSKSPAIHSCLYGHVDTGAARHAFRVAASLDSMVVGEPQILGQLKQSLRVASTLGRVGTVLDRCFSRAFAVAKKVRNQTSLAAGAVSVSSVASELAQKIFGSLDNRQVLLIGAGKMGEVAARKLARSGAKIGVINRSPERAERVARACGGRAGSFAELHAELVRADVVITSTGSDRFVVDRSALQHVVRERRRRPIFIIDIAVPRNIDPEVARLDNVFLYDIDDLQKVAAANISARKREMQPAEAIVEQEAERFAQWLRSVELTPTIVALRTRFRTIAQQEFKQTLAQLESVDAADKKRIEALADMVVNKLLHHPTTELKELAAQADGAQAIAIARRLFGLADHELSDREPAAPQATELQATELQATEQASSPTRLAQQPTTEPTQHSGTAEHADGTTPTTEIGFADFAVGKTRRDGR